MRVLVTGASGFAGSLLIPRLRRDGHQLRAFVRDPARLRIPIAWHVETVRGDVISGAGLTEALEEIEVAYYLIHSMDGAAGRDFPEQERLAAVNFAAAARAAGVKRIVYLGGPLPRGGAESASRHLASRLAVESILLQAVPDSVALRASIVIGAGSRSFRFLVRLIERMPVLTLPAWQRYRTQPIDARDVTDMLAAAAHVPAVAGRALDIGGPEVLSYGTIIERIAELMLVGRPAIALPLSATPIAARVAAAIASEDPELVLPLMESLGSDLLPADDHAPELLGVRLHSFDAAVEHALAEWEAVEPLRAR
ncbi:MAG TPA: NAD(P)H-binding protein [Solirubrobacteraceae bacterium]|jgi:uncharacterized protein YbjT (DUF2867 family)